MDQYLTVHTSVCTTYEQSQEGAENYECIRFLLYMVLGLASSDSHSCLLQSEEQLLLLPSFMHTLAILSILCERDQLVSAVYA